MAVHSRFISLVAYPASVVGPFTEIKTSYFEMNEIRYFVCLLLALIISRREYMKQNLQLERAFAKY